MSNRRGLRQLVIESMPCGVSCVDGCPAAHQGPGAAAQASPKRQAAGARSSSPAIRASQAARNLRWRGSSPSHCTGPGGPESSGRAFPPTSPSQQLSQLGLRDLYSQSRFVVVPLHEVDFDAGVTTLTEAMAMGKAVIVTRTRGRSTWSARA
jgi:glycosyltransferase involved in cell wall biosynthesis